MTETVVDDLEVVEVDHKHGDQTVVVLGSVECRTYQRWNRGPVENASQLIAGCPGGEFFGLQGGRKLLFGLDQGLAVSTKEVPEGKLAAAYLIYLRSYFAHGENGRGDCFGYSTVVHFFVWTVASLASNSSIERVLQLLEEVDTFGHNLKPLGWIDT